MGGKLCICWKAEVVEKSHSSVAPAGEDDEEDGSSQRDTKESTYYDWSAWGVLFNENSSCGSEEDIMFDVSDEIDFDEEEDVYEPLVGKIDTSILYSAIKKLSFLLEVNETVANILIDDILDERHGSYDSQMYGVSNLVGRHSDILLNPEEILNLIKYVEVYQIKSVEKAAEVSSSNSQDDNKFADILVMSFQSGDKYDQCEDFSSKSKIVVKESKVNTIYPSLVCPFRCHIGEWASAIRNVEQRNAQYNGAPCLSSLREQDNERRERQSSFYNCVI